MDGRSDGDDYGDCACDKDGARSCLTSNSRYLRSGKSPDPDSSTKKLDFLSFVGGKGSVSPMLTPAHNIHKEYLCYG